MHTQPKTVYVHATTLDALAASPAFPRIVAEVTDFTTRLAAYFDRHDQDARQALPTEQRLRMAAVNMRATTRCMNLCQAVFAIRDGVPHKLGANLIEPADEPTTTDLPAELAPLIAELHRLEQRTFHLLTLVVVPPLREPAMRAAKN